MSSLPILHFLAQERLYSSILTLRELSHLLNHHHTSCRLTPVFSLEVTLSKNLPGLTLFNSGDPSSRIVQTSKIKYETYHKASEEPENKGLQPGNTVPAQNCCLQDTSAVCSSMNSPFQVLSDFSDRTLQGLG